MIAFYKQLILKGNTMLIRSIILLSMTLFSIIGFADEKKFTLGSSFTPPLTSTEQTGMLDQIMKEAFSRLGLSVSVIKLPSQRALTNANIGIDDGDILRIKGMEKYYPNLVPIPEKIMDFQFVAFTYRQDITIQNWESLKPYQIGLITGWKILEKNTEKFMVTKVENAMHLFELLAKKRVDLILYERLEGLALLKSLKMEEVTVLTPPLAQREMFTYLHKKHAKLAVQLATILQKMKQDGSYETLKQAAFNKFLPAAYRDMKK